MDSDNIYFVDTPLEIQEEYYDKIIEELQAYNISDSNYIYVKFCPIANLQGKWCFHVYITNSIRTDKSFNYDPFLLIFAS